MNNKYYTPEIEELLQFIISEGYILDWNLNKIIIDNNDVINQLSNFFNMNDLSSDGVNKIYSLNPELYRIKYLDQQDIEDCGFIVDNRTIDGDIIWSTKTIHDKEYIELTLDPLDDNRVTISQYYQSKLASSGDWSSNTIFIGYIKNKSELLVILRQLGIK